MNLLIVTPYIPYPLSEGGKVAQYAIIDYLRKVIQITLVVTVNSIEEQGYVQQLQAIWPDVDICAISNLANRKPASLKSKIKSVVKTILRIGKNERLINNEGIETELILYWLQDRFFLNELDVIVKKAKPDLVQIDFLESVNLVHAIPSHVKTVFIHHELRFGRVESKLSTLKTVSPYDHFMSRYLRGRELALLEQYNSIVVFSKEDQEKLHTFLPDKPVYVAPFAVLDAAFKPIDKEKLKINKLVFVGGEEHNPNKNAVEWYINEIAQVVRAKKQLTLHVVGKWKPETIDLYKNNGTVYFAGFVEDLATYCENSIMLVPVRVGSGIRTKILYAMAYGVPVISASIGFEGIGTKDGQEILVADAPEAFATATVRLMEDADFTFQMVNRAQRFVKEKYSQQVAGELRVKYLKEIVAN